MLLTQTNPRCLWLVRVRVRKIKEVKEHLGVLGSPESVLPFWSYQRLAGRLEAGDVLSCSLSLCDELGKPNLLLGAD